MKSSEMLCAARASIENGARTFICFALKYNVSVDTSMLRQEIMDRIHPQETVRDWLEANCQEARDFAEAATPDAWYDAMRLYRLRWIDALISEFEAKGD